MSKVPKLSSTGLLLSLALGAFSCQDKVPFERLETSYPLFQSYWYESEATTYIFYQLESSRRIRDEAVVEYSLDGENWTDIALATNVQQHESVDCGPRVRCGSISLASQEAPASTHLRYRFHREGELADSTVNFISPVRIQRGSHSRSFFVFGIFDETNSFIQWRGRNDFPGLSHEQAVFYGLRRPYKLSGLRVQNQSSEVSRLNPSLYASSSTCEGSEQPASELRSPAGDDLWLFFRIEDIYPQACMNVETVDAKGPFSAPALARKNPVLAPINQKLTLGFTEALQIPFVFASCQNPDAAYLQFQKDRLGMPEHPTDLCLESTNFNPSYLRQLIGERIAAARRSSNKTLALLFVLHYTDAAVGSSVALIMMQTLGALLDETLYPRVAATLVYDSFPPLIDPINFDSSLIWCPTLGSIEETQTLFSCYFQPAKIVVGPIELKTSPYLPDYASYRELDKDQKEGAAIEKLSILAPSEPLGFERLDVLEEGTSYNVYHPSDRLQVGASDYLNFCPENDRTGAFIFREISGVPPSEQVSPSSRLIELPRYQNSNPQLRTFEIGLGLPYPFFVHLQYRSSAALGPKGLSGYIAIQGKSVISDELGAAVIQNQDFNLLGVLNRCTRFCRHPAFDDAGSYLASRAWHEEFQTRCYNPLIPKLPVGGSDL